MRRLSTWLTIVLLSGGLAACGGSNNNHPKAAPHAIPAGGASAATASSLPTTDPRSDYADSDGDVKGKDDSKILDFGHAAGTADRRTITALFKRYYAIAAARDGAGACSLFYLPFVQKLLSGYDQPLGRPPRRGETCATVASKLFELHRYMLAIEVAKLKTIGTRVGAKQGYAVLRFQTVSPETMYMPVHIEAGAWKIDGLFCLSLI